MKTRIIELAEALRSAIQETPAAGLSDEQNAAACDMEWALTKLIEVMSEAKPIAEGQVAA